MRDFILKLENDYKNETLYIYEENGNGSQYSVIDKDTFLSAIEQFYDRFIANKENNNGEF